MQATEFVRKWSDSGLRERQGSHEHFLDLCHLLGEPTPAEDDPKGDRYCFERGAEKVGGGDGWADVWRRGCFAWEYKGKHKNLDAALRQVQAYALYLENPPYLVVCDMERIVVHTNWTNTVSSRLEFTLDDLREPAKLDLLRAVFQGSERLKPGISPQELTAKVASRFGALGRKLQERGQEPRAVAHFLNRLVFCMFAEDAGLLPPKLFTRLVKVTRLRPKQAEAQLAELFSKMATKDSFFGADAIRWFNGGLFEDSGVLPLTEEDLKLVVETAEEHDWSQIDPAVFGTLFEQALKATRERPALGAHYTDREKILKIVEPVIVRPLTAEWEAAYLAIKAALDEVAQADADRKAVFEGLASVLSPEDAEKLLTGEERRLRASRSNLELFDDIGSIRFRGDAQASIRKSQPELTAIAKRRDAAYGRAKELLEFFLAHLGAFRVLDPACGSGNFLYVALHALKDIELRALVDAERLGLIAPNPRVGLDAVRGIEIEPYAAELARVTLWIGDLQWKRKNGYTQYSEPILSSLDQIEERDALLNMDGNEAEWPPADVIVGNPPFVGDKRMVTELGEARANLLRHKYQESVPGGADLVCFWVAKAWAAILGERTQRAGFVTTNSIRAGANRRVISPIADRDALWEVWPDEPWVLEGAAVRVSMLGFGQGFVERRIRGETAQRINSDLTAADVDFTKASSLIENADTAFIGDQKGGPFEVEGEIVRTWLLAPTNPNGRPNSDVVRPWANGQELTSRAKDLWIIDFGVWRPVADASLFEAPFQHLQALIDGSTRGPRERGTAARWWIHQRPRPEMRKAGAECSRWILTPRVAKHRFFVFRDISCLPDSRLVAIAKAADLWLGLLHARHHELWTLKTCSWHGVGNDPTYNAESCFETFPFPDGLTPNISATDYEADPRAIAIADAAKELNRLREAWLNPADLVVIEPEVTPTAAPGEETVRYPDRALPKDEAAAKELKKRTLTNLYNARPAWLANAHRVLDEAVSAAYGWPADLADDEVLERLFALNQERVAAGR